MTGGTETTGPWVRRLADLLDLRVSVSLWAPSPCLDPTPGLVRGWRQSDGRCRRRAGGGQPFGCGF